MCKQTKTNYYRTRVVSFYRLISNLTVLLKKLERLVARQLIDYLSERKQLPELQSAYRAYHSTETAVLPRFVFSVTSSRHWTGVTEPR